MFHNLLRETRFHSLCESSNNPNAASEDDSLRRCFHRSYAINLMVAPELPPAPSLNENPFRERSSNM